MQKTINHEGLSQLTQYYKAVVPRTRAMDNSDFHLGLKFHMRSLEAAVVEHDESIFLKHYRILLIAADIVRALGGCRACNCKSGKDRTSMSVTLEQVLYPRNVLTSASIGIHARLHFDKTGT